MDWMFKEASNFDQNLEGWDISNVTNMTDMFANVTLSTANYDATLIGWFTDSSAAVSDGVDDIPTNIPFHGGDSQYCAATSERQGLIDTHSWTINDGGSACPVKLNPRVYLQGAFFNNGGGNLMRDGLREAGLIPLISPYDGVTTCDASALVDTGDEESIVDWVLVELRDPLDNTNIIYSQSALIQRDGYISAPDLSVLAIPVPEGEYYVSIKHRNHLGVMSESSIYLSEATVTINFTSDVNSVFGGANALSLLPTGKYAMHAGDFDENGQIQNTDINSVILLLGGSGYNEADLDMNGQIQNTDINNILYPNLGKGQQF